VAPPCPGQFHGVRNVGGFCPDPSTGLSEPIELTNGDYCLHSGVHINHAQGCFINYQRPRGDGSCLSGYVGGIGPYCLLRITNPDQDGSCPTDYSHFSGSKLCKVLTDTSSGVLIDELPGGYCPTGYSHAITSCFLEGSSLPVLPGSTTGSGGGFIKMIPMKTGIVPAIPICAAGDAPDANGNCIPNEGHMLNGKCPSGSHSIGTEGNDGVMPICQLDNPSAPTPGTGGTTSSTTGGTTSTPMTTPMKTGGGTTATGSGTTTNTTSAKAILILLRLPPVLNYRDLQPLSPM
jgi:hypothetical protein